MGNKIRYLLNDSGNVPLNLKRATFPLTCSLKLWKCEPSVGIMVRMTGLKIGLPTEGSV